MPRVAVSSNRIVKLIHNLSGPFVVAGSVRELANRLNLAATTSEEDAGRRVHPNRIHALFSADQSQTLNEGTLAAIEGAAARLPALTAEEAERVRILTEALLTRWRTGLRSAAEVGQLAETFGIPSAIAGSLLRSCGELPENVPSVSGWIGGRKRREPDWSFQDQAVARCVEGLRASPSAKIGAVLPTGAGKTRIGLRIALQLLRESDGSAGRVLWVTHRRHLRRQAVRELQKMLRENASGLPDDAAELLAGRIEFVMVSELEARLALGAEPVLAAVVDEGHHAAAEGYLPVFATPYPLRALLLTATPNRTDGLPIGIDRIGYSITYRELVERGAILRPEFLEFPIDDFDWRADQVRDLAEEIIERSRTQFTKTLVIAPRVGRVEEFHSALVEALLSSSGHSLELEDVGFIHSGGNSLGTDADSFLAVFGAKSRAVLVSAQMLLEGFDDPTIDAVVVTYPSQSLITLMQAAGRCLRYAPGKTAAFVMQATNPDLAYRFDHRWMYQEISDLLRPSLADHEFQTVAQRDALVREVLSEHRVSAQYAEEVITAVQSRAVAEGVSIVLFGLPYFGAKKDFVRDAQWGALAVTADNAERFRRIYNDFCAAGADVPDTAAFLRLHGPSHGLSPASQEWRALAELLLSMSLAQREVVRQDYASAINASRPFSPSHATTWLKYVTLTHRPNVPSALVAFLGDCYNRDSAVAAFAAATQETVVIKIPVPLGGYEAHVLSPDAATEFFQMIDRFRATLGSESPSERFKAYAALQAAQDAKPLPQRVMARIEVFLAEDGWAKLIYPDGRNPVRSTEEMES